MEPFRALPFRERVEPGKAFLAKGLGRLILAIMQGEDFLKRIGIPLADLQGIGLAVKYWQEA
jgi:hypothetical protein